MEKYIGGSYYADMIGHYERTSYNERSMMIVHRKFLFSRCDARLMYNYVIHFRAVSEFSAKSFIGLRQRKIIGKGMMVIIV